MKATRTILAMLAVFLLAGCSPKIVYRTHTEYKDSLVTVVHERIVRDTVAVMVPAESEKVVTEDDSSHLENSFAKSDAYIRGGKLHHTLETIPQVIDVPVAVAVADTTTTHVSSEIERKEEERTVYVEKELTWRQKTEMYGFRCMVLLALLYFGWKYRKKIFALARRFI